MNGELDLAIVGLACRFPGAHHAAEFWHNLNHGIESMARLSDQEMLEAGVSPELIARPAMVLVEIESLPETAESRPAP